MLRQETYVVRIYGGGSKEAEPRGVVEIVRRRVSIPFEDFETLRRILTGRPARRRKTPASRIQTRDFKP